MTARPKVFEEGRGPVVQLNLRIPYSVWRRLKLRCAEREVTMGTFVSAVLSRELGEAEREERRG